MPRVYKPKPGGKTYKKYDELVIKRALDELSNLSIAAVSQKYAISKSVLQRHSTKQMKAQGGQLRLGMAIEKYIVANLNICAEWGYPLDTQDLRQIIKNYLDKINEKSRFKNNLPGPDYIQSFLKRHENDISQRICQNIKRARADVSPSVIKEYFSHLKKSIDGIPLQNILNYDETNLSDDPGRVKVIVRRGCKYPERIVNHSKASISLMMAGNAEGEMLPPYVVYKSKHLYDTWVNNGPKNAKYNRSDSGWFDAEIFGDWVKEVVIPYFQNKPGKKVLIGDNLSSHVSVELIELCKKNNIGFVFLPANSTHLTQPLDVAFFRPMKCAWRQILLNWKKTDGRNSTSVPKGCFPRLLKHLIETLESNSSNNIRAGFKKTGICPLNENEVLARLPKEGDNMETMKEAVDESVLRLLKEMRYGTMDIVEPKKKRKLEVVPGKSVCLDDLQKKPEISKKSSLSNIASTSSQHIKRKGIGKKTKCSKTTQINEAKETNKTEQAEKPDIKEKENATENIFKKPFDLNKNIQKETKRKVLQNTQQKISDSQMTNTEVKGNSPNIAKELQNYTTVEDEYFNFTDVDINSLPILFSDGILCNEEITLTSDGQNTTDNDEVKRFPTKEFQPQLNDDRDISKKSKVQIISEVIFEPKSLSQKMRRNSLQLPKKQPLLTKPRRNSSQGKKYYIKEDEILKILED